MHKGFQRTARILAIVAALAMVAACSVAPPSKVTKENYDKLKFGMKYEDVAAVLGETPHQSKRWGLKEFTWADGERHIHVKFAAGRAVYFSSKGLEADAAAQTVAAGTH